MGDFNVRHSDWSGGRDSNNRDGLTIRDYDANNGIEVFHTDEPTHYPTNGSSSSTIDIILNKNVLNLPQPKSLPELTVEHNPIIFSCLCGRKKFKFVKFKINKNIL